jgi:hypothetical protein
VQRIPTGGRVIEVQMGSIHAVKGETHFATLVLETHNHKHSLKSLLPWLLEDASGPSDARGKPVGPQQSKRLACTTSPLPGPPTSSASPSRRRHSAGPTNAITGLRD